MKAKYYMGILLMLLLSSSNLKAQRIIRGTTIMTMPDLL